LTRQQGSSRAGGAGGLPRGGRMLHLSTNVAWTYDLGLLLVAAFLVVMALVSVVVGLWYGRFPARRQPWAPRDPQTALWREVRRRHERF
jgi:hypothetical protein